MIPTYEDAELTTACVESLMTGDPVLDDLDVVIVDNGSAEPDR